MDTAHPNMPTPMKPCSNRRCCPDCKKRRGYRGGLVLRWLAGGEVEFITIMFWDSLEAIRAVTGPDYEKAVVPEERRRHLVRYDAVASHYEVASDQLPLPRG
jgi:heme-degrading monooxygenase HmoA